MYTLELKDKTEIKVHDAPHENSFTVDVANTAELEKLKAKLTKENLEEFKFIEAEGLYSVVSNKRRTNMYSVVEKENGLTVTFYLEDVPVLEQRVTSLETGQEIQDTAIIELAQMQGGV